MTPEIPSLPLLLARGLTKRCPMCGRRGLFRRWFVMAERCPRCGLRFEQREGAFLGSMAVNYGISGIVFGAFLAIWLTVTLPEVEMWPLLIASTILVTLTLIVGFPFSKTIWAAIDVKLYDPADLDMGEPAGRERH